MKNGVYEKITTIVFSLFFAAAFLLCLFFPKSEVSLSERRKLAQFPELNYETINSGKAMDGFEDYSLDQFPFRDGFRTIKAWVQYRLFGQKDNNGIYLADGTVSKLDYPLKEDSVGYAIEHFNKIYKKYFEGTDANIYFSIVPDKNFYLASENGYPCMDYDQLYAKMQQGIAFATHIDLRDCLDSSKYYVTDTHWDQSKIQPVVERLASAMGVVDRLSGAYEAKTYNPFYGVYYGQAALPLPADTLTYLTNSTIENATVFNHETEQEGKVYDLALLGSNDPYTMFLSGSQPLLTITNPNATDDRTLVVFRDSFGSSLTPLLIEAYSKIIVVDTRYVASQFLNAFVDLSEADDVLFLYSSLVLNNSAAFK